MTVKRSTRSLIWEMHIDFEKSRLSITFPFAAVVVLMLLLCRQETVLVSLVSSFFHEAGHVAAMFIFSCMPEKIIFGAFGIRIERDESRFLSPGKEAVISLSGIFVNLILVFCGLICYYICGISFGKSLAAVNMLIAGFNMLPLEALDFGTALRCFFLMRSDAARAERCTVFLSRLTAVFIAVSAVLFNAFISLNVSLIAVSVYLLVITFMKE